MVFVSAAVLKALNPNQTSVAELPEHNLEAELLEGICTMRFLQCICKVLF